ncbi:MAG: glycosyltransferase [Planctomycetes bacterium]|nr:glycosyltransferase [Planctomycetota bacterium]
MAEQYARWLVFVQLPDGSFPDPDRRDPFVFDTGQVLRGLLAVESRVPEAPAALRRATEWMLVQLGDGSRGFGRRYAGEIPETIHLYVLAPLREAAARLDIQGADATVSRAVQYYCASTDLLRPETLSHFYAYQWQALLELGQLDRARAALPGVLARQNGDGSFPAFVGASWVCVTGVAQIAICLQALGCKDEADRALHWMEKHQDAGGAWPGSYGPGSTYFPTNQPAWAVKYFLDAARARTCGEPPAQVLARPANTRLMVLTEELPAELGQKFGGLARLSGYYHPGGAFERATLIDWGRGSGWGELGQDILKLPPEPGVEAWLQACQLLDEKAGPGISDISAGWPGLPESWKAAIAAQRPSCLRVYGARWSLWLGLELKRALGVPLLVSLHNVSGLSRDLLEHADLVMAVSDTVAAKAIELGAAPGRVVTVHNRVNRELFTPDGPPAEGPTGNLRLLCVARDVPQKNLDNLLAACELANQKLPVALTLLHIGSSTRDWSRWPFVVHMDQLEHDKLPAWFRWADAFIMPSRWEGFGIVLIEALACGTPCITSNREPMSGIVQDRWNGLLVNPEDPADIARAIEQMWDSTTRARLAAPARTATEPYDTARIERREAGLYAELLEPRFPRLSVVLPTYNRARLVRAAVLNVLAQDYPDLELLVVNDGSTDGTRELLDDLAATLKDPRLRVLHQTNSRLPRALNAGFAAATGEFLTWTSDDNAFLPGALKAMARELMLDQEAGMVFADYRVVGDNGDQRDLHTGPVESLPERNVIGACFLYRRSAAAAAGEYDPNRELAEDYDYWLRLSKVARLVHLSRSLYLYGDTPDSLSRRRPADVQAAALAVQAGSGAPAALRQQLIRLAGAYKSQGLPWKSLSVGLQLIRQAPLSGAGYKAVARALTPMPLLRLTRRLRGADAG